MLFGSVFQAFDADTVNDRAPHEFLDLCSVSSSLFAECSVGPRTEPCGRPYVSCKKVMLCVTWSLPPGSYYVVVIMYVCIIDG